MAVPIIYLTGVWPLFFVMLTIFVVAVLAGLFHFGPKEQRDREAWLAQQTQQDRASSPRSSMLCASTDRLRAAATTEKGANGWISRSRKLPAWSVSPHAPCATTRVTGSMS